MSVLDDPVLESMPVGYIALDDEWRVTYINAAGEAVVGKDRGELVGNSYWEAFPANVHNEFGRTYREVVRTGEPAVVEAFYPEPLNLWFEVHAVPTPSGLALYFSEVSERRAAQERFRMLARISAELAGALDLTAAVGRIPQLLSPTLADACVITVLGDDGRPREVSSWHADPDVRALLERYTAVRLAAAPPGAPLLRSLAGETVFASGVEILALLPEGEAKDLLRRIGPRAGVTIPLPGRDRPMGALTLFSQRGDTPDSFDLVTLGDIADRVGLALDNLRLFTQQRQVAEELQRHLLSEPVQPDGAEIVVRYLPAAQEVRVGGDWYDAFQQSSGATMLVIGDVVGHDTAAAATMGQLRALLRGIAVYSDAGPAEVLRGLDAAVLQLNLDTYATVAVARLGAPPDGVAGCVLQWSSAGHLPMLVIGPDGTLASPPGWCGELMLGVDGGIRRQQTEVLLEPGSTVLLFTDGLIERRDADLDTGMARLRAAAEELALRPLPEFCDELVERLVRGRPEDDVALVAIRLGNAPG